MQYSALAIQWQFTQLMYMYTRKPAMCLMSPCELVGENPVVFSELAVLIVEGLPFA